MAEGSPYMFPKARVESTAWYERVAGELAVQSNRTENFLTWHIRQWMDDPEETKAQFYKHVTDRNDARNHVVTQLAQPIKTDGYWRQPENNGHVSRDMAMKPVNPYAQAADNLDKLAQSQ